MKTFDLPAALEAREPPEARGLTRDGVRLMVSRARTGTVTHHQFADLPSLLLPGDLLVVNTSRTLPAAVRAGTHEVHFSGQQPDGSWLAEFRRSFGTTSLPDESGPSRPVITLPGGAELRVLGPAGARLWRVRASVAVVPYLLRHGFPIRYSYAAGGQWPLAAYQTVFGTRPGSAEMPSAARPFTAATVTALVTRGVAIAPVTLHCGVSSLEAGEDPYAEWFDGIHRATQGGRAHLACASTSASFMRSSRSVPLATV